ncbi:Hypothetical protein A7982_10616 [Minicystis rosea]|nr:Hypothetical protein A7982_10616 [Minicystis rosea]
MTMKFMTAGIAMAALLAMAACKSESTGGAGGSIGGGGTGGIPGGGGSGGNPGGGGTGGTGPTCQECACDFLLSEGGCKDKCDKDANGNPNTPNFCNGVSALSQCAACIQDSCGAAPSECF